MRMNRFQLRYTLRCCPETTDAGPSWDADLGKWEDCITALTGQDTFCLSSQDPLPHFTVVRQDLGSRPSRQMAVASFKDIKTVELPSGTHLISKSLKLSISL